MLTPGEKSPQPENVPRGGSNPRRCGQRAQALPTELFPPPSMVIYNWEAWGSFWAKTGQSVTALTAWRKKECRMEVANVPFSEVWNDCCSTSPTLLLFLGTPWWDCCEIGQVWALQSATVPFEWKLRLLQRYIFSFWNSAGQTSTVHL